LTECSINECNIDTYEQSSKCILHCEKNDYSSGCNKPGFLQLFEKELISYIAIGACSWTDSIPGSINIQVYEEYLKNSSPSESDLTLDLPIVLTRIVFPEIGERDRFDYLDVLGKLKEITFNKCDFKSYGLRLLKSSLFFQECRFLNKWHIYNSKILDNFDNVLYQSCTFYDDVSSYSEGDGKYIIDNQLFSDCKFNSKIEFGDIIFKKQMFNNSDGVGEVIGSFRLTGCELHEKFILNCYHIGQFSLEDTVFTSKFEFKHNKVEDFRIYNTNYLKLVDMFGTEYKKFNIVKSIFEDFVGFERCVFGTEKDSDTCLVATFTYATFLCFVNFRNTIFNSGLDIENINLKESPNFLNTEINFKYSNRETFRIIKNSFDEIGNHIEANKYFAYEMKSYKKELENTNKKQERLIFFLNEKISNYGQSYVRPICLIIGLSILYCLLMLGYENDVLYRICTDINGALQIISSALNGVSKNILPFSRFLKEGMEFVSLVFYIFFTSLIWQTLVAVKRHTKR